MRRARRLARCLTATRQLTGAFVIVYILGTAAALCLLEPGTWCRRAALLALIFDVLLLATTGFYILWSVGIAACAALYQYTTRRRRLLNPTARA